MTEIQVDIRPTGIESAIVYAPFDKAKEALENKGYRIISLEENAKLRIQQGKDAYISKNGNRTREAFVYDKQRGIYLTKNSPIMENAKEATQTHRDGKEYYLTDEQVEIALRDSVKLSGKNIPTNDFKNNEITSYAFGDIAEDYGLFLKEAGIKEIPVYLSNVSDKPFARQMWFRNLDSRSELYGNIRCLDHYYRVRGVKEIK